MDEIALQPVSRPIDKTLSLPGSKSLTNRALLAAALARGASEIDGLLLADDTRLMVDALRNLGIDVRLDEAHRQAIVHGAGGYWPSTEADIFCGNAGTVMRFLTAACCVGHGEYRLDGVARMRQRPIGELVRALRELGAAIAYEQSEGYCPLAVRAHGLRGGTVVFASPPSSQFVSALLLAAPRASGDVLLDIAGELASAPYVTMTMRVMDAFGVTLAEEGQRKFIVPGGQTYAATKYEVEPDASNASYFLAAAALTGGRVTIQGLGRSSCQGDAGFVNILAQMGCRIEQTETTTTVWGPPDGRLQGVDVDLQAMPDVAPTLAVLAAFADGPTHIRNVASLRVKETDRLAALANELERIGVPTEVSEDHITVRPTGLPSGAAIETYDDHRMAMSFAVAGLRVPGVVIRNPGCVGKTFPGFFELWRRLAE